MISCEIITRLSQVLDLPVRYRMIYVTINMC